MTNKNTRIGRQKPFLLIIEGSQGSGKGTLSSAIRDGVTCTNLISLSGLPLESSAELVYKTRMAELNMLKAIRGSLNIVMDRSFVSDRVYQVLGKKPYTQEEFNTYYYRLCNKLEELKHYYDVKLVLLTASKEDYVVRHQIRADKPQYENAEFSAENSIIQQEIYKDLLTDLSKKYHIDFVEVSTKKSKSEVLDEVMKLIGGNN